MSMQLLKLFQKKTQYHGRGLKLVQIRRLCQASANGVRDRIEWGLKKGEKGVLCKFSRENDRLAFVEYIGCFNRNIYEGDIIFACKQSLLNYMLASKLQNIYHYKKGMDFSMYFCVVVSCISS